MTFVPKAISREGIPAALEKAQRYRLLNEPVEAESICLDILAIDADNQAALVTLLLAITDGLGQSLASGVTAARALVPRLQDEYKRVYYDGIICERYGHALLAHGAPRSGESAYQWLRDAMERYERAEQLRPAGDDDAILRWNTCARLIERTPSVVPPRAEEYEPGLE